jgi:hypothetical protein
MALKMTTMLPGKEKPRRQTVPSIRLTRHLCYGFEHCFEKIGDFDNSNNNNNDYLFMPKN